MSDDAGLAAWRRRLALVRQALKNSAPTGGGGAPATAPVKPPDAPGATAIDRAAGGVVLPSPVVIPPPGAVAAKTLSVKQLKQDRRRDVRLNGERPPTPPVVDRPRRRGDCEGGPRPCALVGCRHHTAVEVSDIGSLKLNHPDQDVEQLGASCSLDVADDGPKTLEQVGAVLNLTRERTRQIEEGALKKLAKALEPKLRGSCRARCGETGLLCRLPAHGPELQHRNERGPFRLVAVEGQTVFAEKRRVEEAASRNPFDDGGVHVRG